MNLSKQDIERNIEWILKAIVAVIAGKADEAAIKTKSEALLKRVTG